MPSQLLDFFLKIPDFSLKKKRNYSQHPLNCLPTESTVKRALINPLSTALNEDQLLNVPGPSLQHKNLNNLKCQLQITNKTDYRSLMPDALREVIPPPVVTFSTSKPREGNPSWPARIPWGLLFSIRQHQHELPKHTLPPPREVLGHEGRQVQGHPCRITGRGRAQRVSQCASPSTRSVCTGGVTDLSSCL